MALTKDAILSAEDLTVAAVDVPEWGGEVFVRVISAAERVKWTDVEHPNGPTVALVLLSACDEQGVRLFDDSDGPALAGKSAHVIDRLALAAAKVNGIDPEEDAEMAKNSGPGQSEDSPST